MALQTPSLTLYVSNLETKVKKPELRSQLYGLFTPYGRVIDIVAKKHDGGRGQAFVVFDDQASATAAMRGLTGENFYGRDLAITYSKSQSNATIARLDPSASRDAAAVKAAKLVVSRAQGEYEQLEKEREDAEAGLGKRPAVVDGETVNGERESKRAKTERADGEDDDEMEIEMEDEEEEEDGVALICTNLPPECSEAVMAALFGQYGGFSKSTSLPPSTSLPSPASSINPGAKAFRIIFSSRSEAEAAMEKTQGYLMQPGWAMDVALTT